MSSSTQEIVHEGWLTKSPPSKRLWKGKWRRRWFVLRQSGELPGQYYLDYYSDRNCRKLKGRIDLDLCDQVDAGLYMERGGGLEEASARGTVFSVRTVDRIYHLKADNEIDMGKWVDAICGSCGLCAEKPSSPTEHYIMACQNAANQQQDPQGDPSPYIAISECVTGPRSTVTNRSRAYTMDAHTARAGRSALSMDAESAAVTQSDDSTKSADDSQMETCDGPPVPPRPKMQSNTYRLVRDGTHRERVYLGSDNVVYHNGKASGSSEPESSCTFYSYGAWTNRRGKPAPLQLCMPSLHDYDIGEEVQRYTRPKYWNISDLRPDHVSPPLVDRNLKPRFGRYGFNQSSVPRGVRRERSHTVQYLDLDFAIPSTSKNLGASTSHTKSRSFVDDPNSAYKTVDFVKTEALNTTRRDAEALRNSALRL